MTNDNGDLFWLWNGIKSRYLPCCIFFFIYCRSIYNPSYMAPAGPMVRVPHVARKLTEEEKKKELEKRDKEWNEGVFFCWILKENGPIRCPDCIANKLTRRKMTNSQAFYIQEFQAWFLKEQK